MLVAPNEVSDDSVAPRAVIGGAFDILASLRGLGSARVSELQRESGLPRDGFVKCDQPVTLPVALLGPRSGRLNPEAIGRVDTALRFVLGL